MSIKLDERYFEKDIVYIFENDISMYTKKSVKARIKLTLEELESAKNDNIEYSKGVNLAKQLLAIDYLTLYYSQLFELEEQEDILYLDGKYNVKAILCCINKLGLDIQKIKKIIEVGKPLDCIMAITGEAIYECDFTGTVVNTTPVSPPNVININDIVLSFSDEASTTYTGNITWEGDIDFWIANMQAFNPNNFITFGLGNNYTQLLPTNMASLPAPYNVPPNTEANMQAITRPTTSSVSQTIFFNDIKTTLETRFGASIWTDLVAQNRRILLFVDVSGSMVRSTVTPGMDEFETFLTSQGVVWNELQCNNERWIKWLVNSALNINDCV
jgi:hypothetical protein